MKLLISIAISSLAWAVNAQDISRDLDRIRLKYAEDHVQAFTVNYQSFEDHNSTEVLETEDALYLRKGKHQVYYENAAVISMYDHGKTILVDREEQRMMILDEPQVKDLYDLPLDSLLKFCENVEPLGDNGQRRSYQLNFKQGVVEYSRMILTINYKKWTIEKLVLFYATEFPIYEEAKIVRSSTPRLEIRYTPLAVKKEYESLLKTEHFIVHKGEEYSPAPSFRHYELISQSQKP